MRTLLMPRYVGLALGLALMLGVFPTGAEAKMVGSLPAGSHGLTGRQAREAEVRRLLAQDEVAKALESAGLTVEEVRSRLDRLSDEQLEELAQHLETIQSGQGTSTALVALALVIVLLAAVIYMMIEQS